MQKNNPYNQLLRHNLPERFLFLFFPALFSISLTTKDLKDFLYFSILFLLWSYFNNGFAGIINDILDKDIDKYIDRKSQRPLVTNKISLKNALILDIFMFLLSLFILFQFNLTAILIGITFLPLILIFPLTKRYFIFPGLALGLIINLSSILSWIAITDDFDYQIIYLYLGCICWSICYDTIYSVPDIFYNKDLGIQSSARFFEPHIKRWLSFFYVLMFIFFAFLGNILILLLGFLGILSLLYLIDIEQEKNCRYFFSSNVILGVIVFLSLILK